MSNDTAAPKKLLLNRAADPGSRPGIGTRLPGASPALPPTDAPTLRTPLRSALAAPAPLTIPTPPVALRPTLQAPQALDAARAPVRASVGPAAPMHAELDRPLSQLVRKPGAKEINRLFEDLVSLGVSDVHMTRSGTSERFTIEARVDGKKQLVHVYEGSEAKTICTLIKTEASMSTGSNLVPEDGSYLLPINGYDYRARAVSLPLHDGGERIVFRLPQTGDLRPLVDLGFTEANFAAMQTLLGIPGGMTLFAGPMGEGKSTTSLSSLEYLLGQDDGVIITLEDPVERVVDGLTQMEVNEDVPGAGFGDMMKFLVRSDFNALFIGEIRDPATATAAVKIAKSGRRVIATIHATDNISAFMRLIGMADETPLSVLDSVNGIVSQRLVPRLVPGTDRFAGRYPIHEVTTNSDELTDALVANISRKRIRSAAAPTSTTFKQNVEELVAAGITTLAEAQKVVRNV